MLLIMINNINIMIIRIVYLLWCFARRDPEEVCKGESGLEEQVEGLLKARAAARKAKDFAKADAIRDELTSMGVVIEDGAKGLKYGIEIDLQ